jgi:uncharacterized protein DUF4440
MVRIIRRFARPTIVALSLVALSFVFLSTRAMCAQIQTTGVVGKWVGIFDIVHADGSVEPGNAYFAFVQNGENVTGTAGESATSQSPVSNGKLTGNTLSFAVVVTPQMTVKFDLSLAGDRIHGTATGIPTEAGSKIIVNATRADAEWRISTAVAHVPDRLFETVVRLDRQLFDAYNNCDLVTLGKLVTDDLEFYHDKTGLATGRQVFLDSIRNNICGKVRRVLVPGSLEVHRLNEYGAVEIGTHRFEHPGHEEEGVGEAKFVMLWRLKGGEWKLTRVISYDHGPAKH